MLGSQRGHLFGDGEHVGLGSLGDLGSDELGVTELGGVIDGLPEGGGLVLDWLGLERIDFVFLRGGAVATGLCGSHCIFDLLNFRYLNYILFD